MSVEHANELAKYRLFRPLTLESNHYDHYLTDGNLAKSIVKWASKITLGGKTYDLKVKPEGVFQIPSNFLNRKVYLMPVWDSDLVRKIVLSASKVTSQARKGCGLGDPRDLKFLGGILVLKRIFFRGSRQYQMTHQSQSGWFVEDRYHMNVFALPCSKPPKPLWPLLASFLFLLLSALLYFGAFLFTPLLYFSYACFILGLLLLYLWLRKRADYMKRRKFQPVFRVFHDSVGCITLPRYRPYPDIDVYNTSIEQNVPEYHPPSEDIIMNWHEMAFHLKAQHTGIYALVNARAEGQWGDYDPIELLGLYGLKDSAPATYLSPDKLKQFTEGQPLSSDLSQSYKDFIWGAGSVELGGEPGPQFIPSTFAETHLPEGFFGDAIVSFLLDKSVGSARYIGNGLFLLKASNSETLAAGTGNWSSCESGELCIKDGPQDVHEDVAGRGHVEGEIIGLGVDLVRYTQRKKIAAELRECRELNRAECEDCANDSLGKTFHDVGVAADVVDLVAGIAACVLTAIFLPIAAPVVCGVTLPAAGKAAKDLWEETIGGYDYAEDVCDGVPDQIPSYEGSSEGSDEDEKKIEDLRGKCRKDGLTPVVERIKGETISCLSDTHALTICKEKSTYRSRVDMKLIGAVCIPGDEGDGDTVVCVFCRSGSA